MVPTHSGLALPTPLYSEASNDYLKASGLMPIALPTRRFLSTRAVKGSAHRTFGAWNPPVPDGTVTAVFSYMTNDELYNTSLVCNAWAALAMDSEVWNWDGVGCATLSLPLPGPTPVKAPLAIQGDPARGVGSSVTAEVVAPSTVSAPSSSREHKAGRVPSGGKGGSGSGRAPGSGTGVKEEPRAKQRGKKH